MPVIISEADNKEYDVVTPTLNINQEKTCKSNNTMSSKTDSFDGKIYDGSNNNEPSNGHKHDKASNKADKDTKEKVCGLNDRETTIENPLDENMEEEETDVDGDCSENVDGDSSDEHYNDVEECCASNEHVDEESSDEYENVDECSNKHEDFDEECSDEHIINNGECIDEHDSNNGQCFDDDDSNDGECIDEHDSIDEESSNIHDNSDKECSIDHENVNSGCRDEQEKNEAAGKHLFGSNLSNESDYLERFIL